VRFARSEKGVLKPYFMEKNKIAVLSLFVYLLSHCFFLYFSAFFAVWAFFTSPC